MTVWLIRAGSHGEYEQKFISEKRVYVTWDQLDFDLSNFANRPELIAQMTNLYEEAKPKTILTWASQIWPFAHEIAKGDLVILPLKSQPLIFVGEVTGDYEFHGAAENPFFHSRKVKWVGESIPRSSFGQDILYSFGAFLTICRIQRNNAEQRILAMRQIKWAPEAESLKAPTEQSSLDEGAATADLEMLARDQIATLIAEKFKGHALTRLVDAILKAQGYTTYRSPEGPDGGVDILASSGPVGFGDRCICVEVKSGAQPTDRPTVDKLLGAKAKFHATHALFVAWNGFKSNVQKELAPQFFELRLWSQNELIDELLQVYDRLDGEIRSEIPLRRVWMVAAQEG